MAEFNLEGLLGNVFGGGGGNYLDEYLTEDQRRMMQRNAMLAASAALLKAGGESTRRIGIGEALGEALQAGQGGYEKAQTGALTQMSLKQKMDEAKRAKALNAQLAGIIGTPTADESPAATANQLMQAGRAAMSAGDFTRGFDFYKQAREVNPRDEVQGGLTQLTDESGKPIMVQQFKSGKVVTAPGYGPPREMVLQDVGGKLIAIDKNAATTGSELTLGMTPYQQFQSNLELEKLGMSRQDLDAKLKNDAQRLSISERELALAVKRFGLNEQEFARGNYEVKEADNGTLMYVSKVPGMPSIPIMGGGNEPLKGKGAALTESQSNAFGFAQRMERVNGILAPLEAAGSYPGVGSAMAGALPFVGGTAQRTVQNADVQRYQQAASDWIRAKLRKESGAAIGVDEAKQEYATYFPMPSDSAAVIEQKRQARLLATEAMKTNAGKTYTPPAPMVPGAGGAGLTWDPAQKKFVNR